MEPAISSLVIVGTVQAIETAILAILGFGIYFAYVGSAEFSHYAALIGITLLISLSHSTLQRRTKFRSTVRVLCKPVERLALGPQPLGSFLLGFSW